MSESMIALWCDPEWVAVNARGFFKVQPIVGVKIGGLMHYAIHEIYLAGYDARTVSLFLSLAVPMS